MQPVKESVVETPEDLRNAIKKIYKITNVTNLNAILKSYKFISQSSSLMSNSEKYNNLMFKNTCSYFL